MNSISFLQDAWDDYLYWQKQDKKMLKRINQLLKEISRTPYEGTGKPEPLLGNLSGFWSRRIDGKNRIVYRIIENRVEVIQCKTHYKQK